MIHELRTPLTSILAFRSTQQRGAPATRAESKGSPGNRGANSRVLLLDQRHLRDESALTQAGAELACEPVELSDIFGMVESVVRPLANLSGIRASRAPSMPTCRSSKPISRKFAMWFENLVGNAMNSRRRRKVRNGELSSVRTDMDLRVGYESAWRSDRERIFERFARRPIHQYPRISGERAWSLAGENTSRCRRRHNARKRTGARVGVYVASADSPSGKGGIATWPNRIK